MNSSLIGGFGKEGPLGSQLAPEKAPLLVQSSGPGETHTDRDRFRLHPKGGARHDVLFAPLEENWDPDVVFEPAGVLPDSEQRPHRGYDGVLSFIANQMEAFTEMWMEPQGFIEIGDRLVVPYRFGGRARHTGIELEFAFAHVFTINADEKVVRCDVYESKEAALDAVKAAS